MTTNPPIVIGEYQTVPAPGSGVSSAWAQQVTRRTIHRFASVAARDAAYPAAVAGAGAACVTTDRGRLWRSDGAVWVFDGAYLPAGRAGVVLATTVAQSIPANAVTAVSWTVETNDADGWITAPGATLTVPAGWDGLYTIGFSAAWGGSAGASQGAVININGTGLMSSHEGALWNVPTIGGVRPLIAGNTIAVSVFQSSAGAMNLNLATLAIGWLAR